MPGVRDRVRTGPGLLAEALCAALLLTVFMILAALAPPFLMGAMEFLLWLCRISWRPAEWVGRVLFGAAATYCVSVLVSAGGPRNEQREPGP